MDNTNTIVMMNPITILLSIVGVIGTWKVLEDRGEKGWKALIPFYNIYSLGKTFGGQKLAVKMIVSDILMILSFFSAIVYFTLEGYEISSSQAVILLLVILFIMTLFVALIYTVKFYRAFDKANNGPSWMILVWLLLNSFGYVYYAFIHKNYNIPGITDKE